MPVESQQTAPEVSFSVIDAAPHRKNNTAYTVEASLGDGTITARDILAGAVQLLRDNLDEFGTRLSSGLDYTVLPGENAGEIRVVTSTPAIGTQDTATRLTIEDPATAVMLLREDLKWGRKHEEGERLPSIAYMNKAKKSQGNDVAPIPVKPKADKVH